MYPSTSPMLWACSALVAWGVPPGARPGGFLGEGLFAARAVPSA